MIVDAVCDHCDKHIKGVLTVDKDGKVVIAESPVLRGIIVHGGDDFDLTYRLRGMNLKDGWIVLSPVWENNLVVDMVVRVAEVELK